MITLEKRIAIAEWLGWMQIEDRSERLMMAPGFSIVGYPPKHPIIGGKEQIPEIDYNTMHKAEEILLNSEVYKWTQYANYIAKAVHDEWGPSANEADYAHASVEQRVDALLRVIGKL